MTDMHKFLSKRILFWVFVSGFLLYLVFAGLAGLRESLSAVLGADAELMLLATACIALSYCNAAATYVLLASKQIYFVPTLYVAVATGLVNRMLPGGLGGIGLNAVYLKKQGYSVPAASAMVATNNAIGFAGTVLLVLLTIVFSPLAWADIRLPSSSWLLAVAVIAAIVCLVIVVRRLRRLSAVRSSLRKIRNYLEQLGQRPLKTAMACMSSIMLSALHVTALYYVLLAIGAETSWGVALLAVSAGAFIGAVVPTPGGLGGAEAGIAGTLIAFGIASPLAVSAALAYRLLTYWAPLLPGYAALRVVEKRYL